jgi:hypothetical protein
MKILKYRKWFSVKGVITITSSTIVSLGLMASAAHAKEADLLIIESIKNVRPAGGIDSGSTAGFGALGGILAGGATIAAGGAVVVGTGGAAIGTVPVTALAVAKAAASGASAAVGATRFLDSSFSGTDQLIVKVNGKKVYPKGEYEQVKKGQVKKLNKSISFDGKATIQLIEWDSDSDNDDLGHIDINANAYNGEPYRIEDAIVSAPLEEDGSVYYVTYRVEPNKGNNQKVVKYMLCGTNDCMSCPKSSCKVSYSGKLDRDKDKGDLKKCPSGFKTNGYRKFDQIWPAADVYLRKCEKK